MGVLYAPDPLPSSEASQAAKKMKACLGRAPSSKTVPPLAKTGLVKKVGIPKTARPKAKPGL
jgi:hypothetical protein